MDVGMADAGQGFVMSPCTQRRKNALIRMFLAETMAYGDQPLAVGR
jgi:hypothetical protein